MSPASLVGPRKKRINRKEKKRIEKKERKKKKNKQAVSNSSIFGNHFHIPEKLLAILITSPLALRSEVALLSLKGEGK